MHLTFPQLPEPIDFSNFPEIEMPRDYHMADFMHEKLVEMINEFEANLPDNQQAGGRLVNFGETVFSIDDIGYQNPDIIIFYGTLPDGATVQLVQHVSQLNVLLVAVDRQHPEEPRRKIGFEVE